MLKAVAPSRRRARIAGLGVATLVCAGALAAYAAQPSSVVGAAPERLAAQAAGVVGSSDQLALRVVEDSKERTLKPGDAYADGWMLNALTPSSATLAKDGERRQVGLNPTGALTNTSPAAPPSQVRVLLSDDEILARVRANPVRDGQPMPGMTAAETERYRLLIVKGGQLRAFSKPPSAAPPPTGGPIRVAVTSTTDLIPWLGPEGPEFADLLNKMSLGYYNDAVTAYQRYGPVEIPRSADSRADTARMQEYPGARWSGGPAGYVMVMPATAPTLLPIPATP